MVGPHLARFIDRQSQSEIYGTVRARSNTAVVPPFVKRVECDLRDAKNVDEVISDIRPDYIFHLAAQSFVKSSWNSPSDTLTNNIISEVNILEGVKKYVPECIMQIAGSSEEYGNPESTPITEEHDLKPLSPYGVSKVAQEKLGYQYHKSYGLKIILTRAFNHTGPGRDPRFAEASFAKQIADAKDGDTIKVGNLLARRDYTDVRDTVEAYWLATQLCNVAEPYNICSGEDHSIQEILDDLITISGKKIDVEQDPNRMRPSDIMVLLGSCAKFKKTTGWSPKYTYKQTLTDLYESFANS